MTDIEVFDYVIVGGGIAGVSCAEHLSLFDQSSSVLLITASPLIKAVTNVSRLTKLLESFTVVEKDSLTLESQCTNVRVVHAKVEKLDSDQHLVHTSKDSYRYCRLCICSGGEPKMITKNNPNIIGIRDTESAVEFQKRISSASRIVIIGNGGIATELVYEVEGVQVVWAIKDKSITATFIDAGAAEFLQSTLNEDKQIAPTVVKRMKYTTEEKPNLKPDGTPGGALGPDWHSGLHVSGPGSRSHDVHMEMECEVQQIMDRNEFLQSRLQETKFSGSDDVVWPVYVELTNKKVYGCDFVVSATGVIPNTSVFCEGNHLKQSTDGGILVDQHMRSSVADVYAAGDVCTPNWDLAKHWFQMRLWSQARLMGAYAAKCMWGDRSKEDVVLDFGFELFAHMTKFFGYKVVLLGLFNGQGLGTDYEILLRVTKGMEYVKVILQNGRMQGAILIGETDLEETFENLILNQLDLSMYGEDLLNPDIDIDHYFD